MSRGVFEMEAMGSTCISTQSGVLLVAGRFPAITIQASWDGGFSFKFFTVDTSSMWGNGAMVEIAPDVVLFGAFPALAMHCAHTKSRCRRKLCKAHSSCSKLLRPFRSCFAGVTCAT